MRVCNLSVKEVLQQPGGRKSSGARCRNALSFRYIDIDMNIHTQREREVGGWVGMCVYTPVYKIFD